LWDVFDFLRTRGKGYQVCAGAGVIYLNRDFHQIRQWAGSIDLSPIGETHSRSWFHPLPTSGSVLLIAVRKKQASAA